MSVNNILNISSNLKKIVSDIEKKSVNKELLREINVVLNKVIDIISSDHNNEEIASIISSLIVELSSINIADVKVEAFEYLGYIIYDLDKFLNDYFIDNIHKDEYIIRDSLDNNVNFFINNLHQTDTNSSSLEFF